MPKPKQPTRRPRPRKFLVTYDVVLRELISTNSDEIVHRHTNSFVLENVVAPQLSPMMVVRATEIREIHPSRKRTR